MKKDLWSFYDGQKRTVWADTEKIRLNHLHIVAFCKWPMFKLEYLLGKNPLGKKLSWMKRILNNPFWYKSSLLHQSIAKQSILCSLGIIQKQALHERRMNYDTICRIVNGDFINKVAIFLLFTSCVTFLSTHTFTYVGLSKQKQHWCI